MVELFIFIIIILNYIIPFKGIIKVSKAEAKIMDNYQHIKIKITDNTEDLIGESGTGMVTEGNGEFATMNVLGNLDGDDNDSKKSNNDGNEDYTDVNLKELY